MIGGREVETRSRMCILSYEICMQHLRYLATTSPY